MPSSDSTPATAARLPSSVTGLPVYESKRLKPLDIMVIRDPFAPPLCDNPLLVTGSLLYFRGRVEIGAEVRAIVRRVMLDA